MKTSIKCIVLFFLYVFTHVIYASSALYMNKIHGKHFLIKNAASGDEAEPQAKAYCEEESGIGNCELIYKTDYGGYGAIAVGNKSQGYSKGSPSQSLADKVSLRNCKIDSTPSTCRITSRWHDEGKRIPRYKYIWVPDEENYDHNFNANGVPIYCGVSRMGGAKDCNTGRDGSGNF
ncbi:MAG: DUF4189 domain-containing protein [Chitinophagaceae bacterium]